MIKVCLVPELLKSTMSSPFPLPALVIPVREVKKHRGKKLGPERGVGEAEGKLRVVTVHAGLEVAA